MSRAVAALIVGALSLLVADRGEAAREAVLKSVAAPHSYYWRELYLPQLTSGPSAGAFSPDGSEVIFSMVGSLWRQRVDEQLATELTHGPGYDYQPDWSRDGRWVVFVRHDRDAIALVVLDLQTGTEHALTTPDTVDVEPRFSPDGKRLAFVTAREGTFNVWTARFADGKIDGARPLLPPHTSTVPRYYYAAVDHAINPSWTPDGEALLLVSNRDIAWGTGDIWRVPLADPSQAKMLLREETSWSARPEMAPDGRRLLYSSYHGRQWHQLWLAAADGASPMPLTFGEFDRRNARWSPDGKRVLYVSNESGNTSLWVQDVVGGKRIAIGAGNRLRLRASGAIFIAIRDEAGEPLPARVTVLGSDGRHYGPDDAWLHADDLFDRRSQSHEEHYFHCPGDCRVVVPFGKATVRVQRGLATLPVEREVTVAERGVHFDAILKPHALPSAWGAWTCADLHTHMNYGGTYRHEPETYARVAAAEDLDVIYNTLVNKEQRIPNVEGFSATPFRAHGTTLLQAQEYHTSYWGHLGLLHLSDALVLPDFAAYRATAFASPYPHNGVIADLAHAQGAIVGYVHPYDWNIVPASESSLSHQFPADVAHRKVDYLELVSFSQPRANEHVWHRVLNLGYRVAAGAGTDAMGNYASLRGPVGLNRTCLQFDAAAANGLRDAIRDGRGFVTNAPLLALSVDDHKPGDTISLAVPKRVSWRASIRSIVPLDHADLLVNGKVVQRLRLRDRRDGDFDGTLKLERSGWVAVRAYADDADPLVLDSYPYGHTNPVYVSVGDVPPRAPDDARYFVQWLDRVIADAAARDDYNDDTERQATLGYLRAARAILEKQAAP